MKSGLIWSLSRTAQSINDIVAVRPVADFRHGHKFLLRRHIVIAQHHANSVYGSLYNATNVSRYAASKTGRLVNDALGSKWSGLFGMLSHHLLVALKP